MPSGAKKVDKIIATNASALEKKYDLAGWRAIEAAVRALITSDRKRGLVTRLYLLDHPASMNLNAPRVTDAVDPKQNKVAIDAVCKALAPDYLMILGSIDVVPHQDLKNPMYSPLEDPDKLAFGDLPYACEAGYSQRPQDFFGPTRVVGRLPDVTGAKDPGYLIRLLGFAAKYKSVEVNAYRSYCGISAEIWKWSSTLSVTSIFGNGSDLKTVPPSRDKWPPPFLGRLSHFVNCHGAPQDSRFFGQPGSGAQDFPVALDASYLNLKVAEGTTVAAECCYGGQLFNPALNTFHKGQLGICYTYLANKCYGFFGSTTIAYGPAEGNDAADLICQYFLRSVFRGASLGRAALEARQEFVHRASMADPDNVKTIAQFNLYADPSQTPVKTPHGTGLRSKTIPVEAGRRVARAERRRDLFGRGIALAISQPVIGRSKGKVTGSERSALRKKAAEYGVGLGSTLTFDVRKPRVSKSMPLGLVAKEVFPNRVHVVFQSAKTLLEKTGSKRKALKTGPAHLPALMQTVAIVVKEANGIIISAKKIFSKRVSTGQGDPAD